MRVRGQWSGPGPRGSRFGRRASCRGAAFLVGGLAVAWLSQGCLPTLGDAVARCDATHAACPGGASCDVAAGRCVQDPPAQGDFSDIAVTPADRALVVQETGDLVFRVTNPGRGRALRVDAIEIDYVPAGDAEAAGGPSFDLDAGTLPASVPADGGEGATPFEFRVRHRRYDDGRQRTAVVTLRNDNTRDAGLRTIRWTLTSPGRTCSPTVGVPPALDLGLVRAGETREVDLVLSNPAKCAATVYGIAFDGDPGFTLRAEGREYPSAGAASAPVLPTPVVVPAEGAVTWKVGFVPASGDPAQAVLSLTTDDPAAPGGRRVVQVSANGDLPCLRVVPDAADFGAKLRGAKAGIEVSLESCGRVPLEVREVALAEPANPEFQLEFSAFGRAAPTAGSPWSLEPGAAASFLVTYAPTDVTPFGQDGQPLWDLAQVRIAGNGFQDITTLPARGFGVEVDCPSPVIQIEEGEEVSVGTVLHLHGEQSVPASGSLKSLAWTVTGPEGNHQALVPSASFATPTYQVDVEGEYRFCLDACDSSRCSGDETCRTTVCRIVHVVAPCAIHVELTWDTPGDPDPYDTGTDKGTDLNLHFTHPFASGEDLDGDGKPDGWFDVPYDCFWFNQKPDWETTNPSANDDPRLDRDDDDGAGPENLNLCRPVNGRVYRVGVHGWDDHGYGPSYPWVRIYLYDQLVFERNLKPLDVLLQTCDLWEVARITWGPTPKVEGVQNPDGSQKITPKYMPKDFAQPGGTNCL